MAVGVPRPATQPDAYTTPENQTLNVPAPGVLANDGPPGTLTAHIVNTVPAGTGTLTLNQDGSFDYIPQAGFNGTATFQYRANAGVVQGYMATVTITVGPVNDPPVANSDTATGKSGSPIQIAVLANDTDVDDANSALRVASVTTPTTNGGMVSIAPNGLSVTYTSAAGFSGTDTFDYVARDAANALSGPATVTVTVLPNAPPVAVADNPPAVLEDSGPLVISVLANDSDPDGDPLSVSSVSTPTGGGGTAMTTNGQTVTYTPALNFSGTTSFTYQVSDGFVTSQALVTVTVTPVSDPPVAVNDVFQVTRYGVFTVDAPGVLANDSDPENAPLTAILVTGHATLVLGSNGSVTYTPPVEFIGNRTLTYRANDGALNSANATARFAKLLAVKKAEFTNPAGTAQDKWTIEGKASLPFAGTSVTIYVGATPGGTPIATNVPIIPNAAGTTGNWKYTGTGNIVPPDGTNMISIQSNNGTIFTHVPVTLK
jgi:large repetitive protein